MNPCCSPWSLPSDILLGSDWTLFPLVRTLTPHVGLFTPPHSWQINVSTRWFVPLPSSDAFSCDVPLPSHSKSAGSTHYNLPARSSWCAVFEVAVPVPCFVDHGIEVCCGTDHDEGGWGATPSSFINHRTYSHVRRHALITF